MLDVRPPEKQATESKAAQAEVDRKRRLEQRTEPLKAKVKRQDGLQAEAKQQGAVQQEVREELDPQPVSKPELVDAHGAKQPKCLGRVFRRKISTLPARTRRLRRLHQACKRRTFLKARWSASSGQYRVELRGAHRGADV